jgi:hypothetical protein
MAADPGERRIVVEAEDVGDVAHRRLAARRREDQAALAAAVGPVDAIERLAGDGQRQRPLGGGAQGGRVGGGAGGHAVDDVLAARRVARRQRLQELPYDEGRVAGTGGRTLARC